MTTQATFCATLVDEWARAGVGHAVIAPGSRSTPLALALVADGRIAVHVHHDERCAGFMALGVGLATGTPAVVLCTSGTAATHLHAAVAEANQAAVPLMVCTADRPPELRDVGAPQTIDQTHLYGRAVRWFFDPGPADEAMRSTWRSIAARAVTEAADGPVHLNLPFRDPLVGEAGELPAGRSSGAAWRERMPDTAPLVDVEAKGVVVLGRGGHRPHACDWPILMDPLAPHVDGTISHADLLLRVPELRDELRPEVVVRIGAPPASRVLNEWLAGCGALELVDSTPWSDPAHTAADAGHFVLDTAVAPPGWLDRWRALDAAADAAVEQTLAAHPEPTEPGTARALLASLPAGATLVVSSSMPIRDLEWYARPRADVTVLANRGANGIDGVVSTAVGVALAKPDGPTVALVGDVAFLHDTNALLGLARRDIDLTIVVIDNDGGGIFSFLPQASALPAEQFELLFGTPHGVRVEELAAAHGLTSITVEAADALGPAVQASITAGGSRLVVVRTDRAANVTVHDELNAAVAAAVSST